MRRIERGVRRLVQTSANDVRHHSLALAPGVLVDDRYRLIRVLSGSSPCAITYLAHDESTQNAVAIKEFLPRSLVARGSDGVTVRPHSADDSAEFTRSLRRFLNEGSVLSDLAHENLVHVRAVCEANGTAYLVMDFSEGHPLAQLAATRNSILAPQDAVPLVLRLLGALEQLHGESVLHRDISPQSVFFQPNGAPLLLGFSSRRHVPGQSMELAAGFAAFEQYGSRDVGPWTDVYASAALLYWLITGVTPPSALDRAGGQVLQPPNASVPELAPAVAMAVVRGLSLLPEQRPHGPREFRRQLETAVTDPAAPTIRLSTGAGLVSSLAAEARAMPLEMQVPEEESSSSRPNLRMGAGVVMPGEEGSIERIIRKLGDVAARLRGDRYRSAPVMDLRPAPVDQLEREQVVLDPVLTEPPSRTAIELHKSEPLSPVAPADVLPELSVAPATEVQPGDASAAQAQPSVHKRLSRAERRRRRLTSAVIIIVLLTLSASGLSLAAKTGVIGLPTLRANQATTKQSGQPSGPVPSTLPLTNGRATQAGADSMTNSRRLEAYTTRLTPAPISTPARAASARKLPPIPALNLSLPKSSAELRIVPPELLVDLKSHMQTALDALDQGEYAAARRGIHTTLGQVDSTLKLYPESQSLKTLKGDLEQADKRALQACQAENDMLRRRGGKMSPCE